MADPAVERYFRGVAASSRGRDASLVLALMERLTGEEPRMWGASIVGFGRCHYESASGHKGDGPAAAFAARRPALVIYLVDGIGAHADDLAALGPHTTGVSCLYLKDVTAV